MQSYKKKFYSIAKIHFTTNLKKNIGKFVWIGNIVEKLSQPMQMMLYLVCHGMKHEEIEKFSIQINTIASDQVLFAPEKTFENVSQMMTGTSPENVLKEISLKKPKTDLEFCEACYECLFKKKPITSIGSTERLESDQDNQEDEITLGSGDDEIQTAETESMEDEEDEGEETQTPRNTSTKNIQESPGPSKKRNPLPLEATPKSKKKMTPIEVIGDDTPKTYKTLSPLTSFTMYAKNTYVFRSHSSGIMVRTNDLLSLYESFRRCTTEYMEMMSMEFHKVLRIISPMGWILIDKNGEGIDDNVSCDKMYTYISRHYNMLKAEDPIE